jgi:hypothetical protein
MHPNSPRHRAYVVTKNGQQLLARNRRRLRRTVTARASNFSLVVRLSLTFRP